jgi:hypothetical protein
MVITVVCPSLNLLSPLQTPTPVYQLCTSSLLNSLTIEETGSTTFTFIIFTRLVGQTRKVHYEIANSKILANINPSKN